MNVKTFLAIFLIIIFAIIILAVYFEEPNDGSNGHEIYFEPLELSSAGEYGYVTYYANGSSYITILALTKKPIMEIYIFNKSLGIGIESFDKFTEELNSLKEYGLHVKSVSSLESFPEDSLVVIPQGAMPEAVLPLLENNITLLYIGKTDALLSKGVVHEEWYGSLENSKKSKIVLFNTTLDELYNQEGFENVKNTVLFNSWALASNKTYNFFDGKGTATILSGGAEYIRVIYPIANGYRVADSEKIAKPKQVLSLGAIFPSEVYPLYLTFEDSKGIPELSIYKDGEKLSGEKLGTVGQDVFYKSLSFEEPGEYILRINDYEAEIASGILHVNALKIIYINYDGFYYNFYVTLDNIPVDSEDAVVSLVNSNQTMDLYLSDGKLAVPAKLKKGVNTFIIKIYGQEYHIDVEYNQQGVLDLYLQYGPWIILITLCIYFSAITTRKHPYKIKFDSVVNPSSGEVRVNLKEIENILSASISEFGSNGCINAREFSIALRKYITDGHDVMDGNAEAILKKLERNGHLDSYKSFYRLKGKEDVKKAVMDRLIREKLIAQGIAFKYINGVFHTKEQQIVFGKMLSGEEKTIVIFESKNAVMNYLESLPQKTNAKIALKIRNGSLVLLSIEELAEYL